MSWLSENYEKAALGGAAVIALAVGASILGAGSDEPPSATHPKENAAYEVAELAKLAELVKKAGVVSSWNEVEHLGQPLAMFVGAPVYSIKGDPNLKEFTANTEFDGIPLSWWKKHGLHDYRYENSGARDADKDGFSNKEEFVAGTNPADAKGHPDLVEKLQFISSKSQKYRIQWTMIDAVSGNFSVKSTSGKYRRRPASSESRKVGELFPARHADKAFVNRFKTTKKGNEVNPATSMADDFFDILDTKKNTTTRLWYSDRGNNFADWSATLKLNTPDGGSDFKVDEGSEFSLPFAEGGKGYKFTLKKRKLSLKSLKNIQIEYLKDGNAIIKNLEAGVSAP